MIDLSNLQLYQENNRIEVKRAASSIPNSIWETYSSFANTDGGIILLGVDEAANHSFVVSGVNDSKKIITDFWNQINNPQKVNANILLERMVYIQEVEGKTIVVIEVPRAERSARPIFIDNNLLSGTFRRNGEGDYHCTKEQISAMLRDASDVTQDKRVLTELDNTVFCKSTIKDYRDRFNQFHSNHVWVNDDDEMFLRHIGAVGLSKEDQKYHPTVAGLLMFGYEYEITRELSNYFLDYREELDSQVRWSHRIVSTSGDWSGNIYDFFFRVYPRLIADLPVPFALQDGLSRIDEPDTHKAMRELLLNTLAHADHYGRQGIVIRRDLTHLHFANPGCFRIELRLALQGGNSDPRNTSIMKMFGLVNIGDRAGSGMSDAISILKNELKATIAYREMLQPERTMLDITLNAKNNSTEDKTRDKIEKQGIKEDKTRDKIEKQGIKENKTRDKIYLIEGISEKTRDNLLTIVDYILENKVARNNEIAQICNVGSDRARVLLLTLVENGILRPEGDKKDRRYTLY